MKTKVAIVLALILSSCSFLDLFATPEPAPTLVATAKPTQTAIVVCREAPSETPHQVMYVNTSSLEARSGCGESRLTIFWLTEGEEVWVLAHTITLENEPECDDWSIIYSYEYRLVACVCSRYLSAH